MNLIAKTIFLILVLQVINCFAQTSSELEKWLQIKLFVNTRDDVEKIYGKGKFGQNQYFVSYKTKDFTVSIDYSPGECEIKYSDFNIPEWTVTEVSYNILNNPPKLKDLVGNKNGFKTRQNGDGVNHIQYYDETRGIFIVYDDYLKEVIHITIKPTIKDKQKFACDNLK